MKNKLLLLLILTCFRMFAQTGEIHGKLVLQDVENIESVRNNTWVILKTQIRTDSVKVDKDLNFVFKDVKADTVRIYIKPRTYPIDRSYRIYFNGKESKKLELEYSSTCPFGKKENNSCPVCKKKDKVIPIRYGLMAEIRNKKGELVDGKGNKIVEKKYKSGGCVISDCQPNWFCERDEKDF
jgi:hypothetical protein